MISLKLITAYQNADYHVLIKPDFKFNIGIFSENLNSLLIKYSANGGFFLTAFNPRSKVATKTQNEQAHEQLKSKLTSHKINFLDAVSTDPKAKWSAEYGFIILGIDREKINLLTLEFGQNALVSFERWATPKLLLCDNLGDQTKSSLI